MEGCLGVIELSYYISLLTLLCLLHCTRHTSVAEDYILITGCQGVRIVMKSSLYRLGGLSTLRPGFSFSVPTFATIPGHWTRAWALIRPDVAWACAAAHWAYTRTLAIWNQALPLQAHRTDQHKLSGDTTILKSNCQALAQVQIQVSQSKSSPKEKDFDWLDLHSLLNPLIIMTMMGREWTA